VFITSVSENSAIAGLYLFSFGLASVIPMIFGLLSLVLAMSSAILLNNWSAFVQKQFNLGRTANVFTLTPLKTFFPLCKALKQK
jgi:hypothetical protein